MSCYLVMLNVKSTWKYKQIINIFIEKFYNEVVYIDTAEKNLPAIVFIL